MSLLNRDKSLRQYGLQQLIGDDYNLNSSSSASFLNQSSSNNISALLSSNKILPMNQEGSVRKYYAYPQR